MIYKGMAVLLFGLALVGCSMHSSPEVQARKAKRMTAKQFCYSEGGSWIWSSRKNKWICSDVNMTIYYQVRNSKYTKKFACEDYDGGEWVSTGPNSGKCIHKRFVKRVYNDYFDRNREFCESFDGIWQMDKNRNKMRCFVPESEVIANAEKIEREEHYKKIYSMKPIGSVNFKDAKYINGVIWEDTPFNAQAEVDYMTCEEHCKNLELLGVQGWQIPSIKDYKRIIEDGYKKLDYKKIQYSMRHNFEYWTRDNCGEFVGLGNTYGPDSCAYDVTFDPTMVTKISTWNKAWKDWHLCRCALYVDVYNNAKRGKIQALDNSVKGFSYYLKKFYLTDDVQLLKKAESLAKTRKEKAEVEKAYINFIGDYWKVFKVYSNNQTSAKNKIKESKLLYSVSIADYRKSRYKVTLKQNPKSPIRLKYGSYNIPVEIVLKVTYQDISGIGSFSVSKNRTESIRKVVTFHLNRQNGYKDTKNIDFGSLQIAEKGHLAFIKTGTKIIDAHLEYKIKEIK